VRIFTPLEKLWVSLGENTMWKGKDDELLPTNLRSLRKTNPFRRLEGKEEYPRREKRRRRKG